MSCHIYLIVNAFQYFKQTHSLSKNKTNTFYQFLYTVFFYATLEIVYLKYSIDNVYISLTSIRLAAWLVVVVLVLLLLVAAVAATPTGQVLQGIICRRAHFLSIQILGKLC